MSNTPNLVGADGLPIERTTPIVGKQNSVHPDAMVHSVRFATWHVTLFIQHSPGNSDVTPRVYYVRIAGVKTRVC